MGIHLMVGKTGFEPATPWSQTRCSTKLSHFPNFYGAPKRSRTPNLLIRSQTLYPIELWALFSWCLGPESNRHGCHHPQDFKSCASTSSATQAFRLFQGTRLFLKMVSCRGLEPLTLWLKVRCSTNWASRTSLAGLAGFEPAHDGVKVRCLTAWL